MEEGSSYRYYQQQEEQQADIKKNKKEKTGENVGLKMLMKMGYKPGEGLGAKGQGIKEPIPLEIMPKNAGLGSIDSTTTDFDSSHKQQKQQRKKVRKNKFSDYGSGKIFIEDFHEVDDLPSPESTEGDWSYHHTIILDSDLDRLKVLQKLAALQAHLSQFLNSKHDDDDSKKVAEKYLLEGQLREYREYEEQVRLMQLEKKAHLQVVREARKRAALKGPIDVKATYSSIFPLIDDPVIKFAILLTLLPKAAANQAAANQEDFYETLLWVKEELPTNLYQRLFDKLSFHRALQKDLSKHAVDGKERLKALLQWRPLLPESIYITCLQALPPVQFKDWPSALELTPLYLQLDCTSVLLHAYAPLPFINQTDATGLLNLWREAGEEDLLIQRYLFHNLARLAERIVIDPSNQETHLLQVLLEWRSLLGDDRWFTLILKESGLFLRLRTVLYQWLQSNNNNVDKQEGYREIVEWYSAWKHFIFNSSAKDEFIALLKIMEHFLNINVGKELPKPLDVFLI